MGMTLRLTSRLLLLLLRNQQQQPHRQVQQPNRTPPRGELLRSFLHQSSAATREVLQNATNKLRPTSLYRQREYIHHHFVGVVGRATFRDIPAAVDMDTVSAPGGRNIIRIHVPGGLPGSSPADLGRAPRGGPSSGGVYFSTAYLNRLGTGTLEGLRPQLYARVSGAPVTNQPTLPSPVTYQPILCPNPLRPPRTVSDDLGAPHGFRRFGPHPESKQTACGFQPKGSTTVSDDLGSTTVSEDLGPSTVSDDLGFTTKQTEKTAVSNRILFDDGFLRFGFES